ncbi:Olfactory receptor, partial [Pristimantis euphronides]
EIVEVINPVAFRLKLPIAFKIHNVFHKSLLKEFIPPSASRCIAPPQPIVVLGHPEFEVRRIVDCRRGPWGRQFLVDWRGYGPEDRSWVKEEDLHADRLVREFFKKFPDRAEGPNFPPGYPRQGIQILLVMENNLTAVTDFFLTGFQGNHYVRIILFYFLLLVFGATICGNLLIIILVSTSKNLHTPMYFFISQLAISDMLLTTDISPMTLHILLNNGGAHYFYRLHDSVFCICYLGSIRMFPSHSDVL